MLELGRVLRGNITISLPTFQVGIFCCPFPETGQCYNGFFCLSECTHPYIFNQTQWEYLAMIKMGMGVGCGNLEVCHGSFLIESVSQELMYSWVQHHMNNKTNILLGLGFHS